MTPKVAMCTCGEPLVCTFHFRGAELYCLSCGCTYGWFGPEGKDETPELLARMEAIKAEWGPIAQALLTPGSWRQDCPACGPDNPHIDHATDDEKAAHEDALAKMQARLRVAEGTRG